MKYGIILIRYLQHNQTNIREMQINGHPENGFLKITLTDGRVATFDGWDEEDQGLFACAMNGEEWNSSKRGIPSKLAVSTESSSLAISSDKSLEYTINDSPLNEWGTETSSGLWHKHDHKSRTKNDSSDKKQSSGDTKKHEFGFGLGFLNK